MIQDIFPHKLDNQWSSNSAPTVTDRVLCFDGRNVLVKAAATNSSVECDGSAILDFSLPVISDFSTISTAFPPLLNELTYLFRVDDEAFFLLDAVNIPTALSQGDFQFKDISFLRENGLLSKPMLFAILTGKHLETWYGNTKFCGKCGAPMKHSSKERAMICTSCNNTVYPRIMPAVIVGVKNGDRLLLTKYRRGYGHNALIAGFVEIGETLEETVAREVMEEAGVKVKNITYYKSQPWGVASDILTGFYCEVDGDDTIHMDEGELKYADWVERSKIELQPDDNSLTNEMMKMFRDGLT